MRLLMRWSVVDMGTTACGKERPLRLAVMANAVTQQRIQLCLSQSTSLYAVLVGIYIESIGQPLKQQRVVSAVRVDFNHNTPFILN